MKRTPQETMRKTKKKIINRQFKMKIKYRITLMIRYFFALLKTKAHFNCQE
ncbi:hypothetical protein L21SP5_00020 [Salinivirga cyanobacteriivorans]|uniref:Uncharacterized protein n=1 Tax=Salinivirga cyanobacteriivorans TaxID=1307839 RepID=A0A0S2HUQ4_9BACT|nr:hypothetical protein L21SP5_00020 [Salinivirga cyanobacteriivorans]